MAFIEDIPFDQATGDVREAYESDLKALGYIANYTKVLALRPRVRAAWIGLIGAIRSTMDQRRYELITLAPASRLRSSY
jgi:hypothetical protein